MKKTKRMKITFEKERLLVVSRRGQVEGWCEACGAEVKMIGVEEAALIADLSQRAIFRWIESDRLHFAETSGGALLICLASLLAQTREGSA